MVRTSILLFSPLLACLLCRNGLQFTSFGRWGNIISNGLIFFNFPYIFYANRVKESLVNAGLKLLKFSSLYYFFINKFECKGSCFFSLCTLFVDPPDMHIFDLPAGMKFFASYLMWEALGPCSECLLLSCDNLFSIWYCFFVPKKWFMQWVPIPLLRACHLYHLKMSF